MRARPDFGDPRWRALTILCVYGYQGMVGSFGLTVLPNHFAALGAGAGAIGGFSAAVAAPWALQPLWGPVVDRFGFFRMGRRRAWVLIAFAAALACLALLPLVGDGVAAMPGLALVLLAHSAAASLLDTALDGMMIDRVPEDRLGQATALTRVGFVGGTALGAALFASVVPAHGLAAAAGLLLLLGAAAASVPLLVREAPENDLLSLRRRPGVPGAAAPVLRLVLRMVTLMRRPEALALLALCIAEEFATGVFGVRLAVEMIQQGGWSPEALSRFQGGLALLGGTLGALGIGWWSDRAGPYRVLAVLLALCAAAYAGSALLLLGPPSGLPAALAMALTSVVPALMFVSLAPAVMRSSRGAAAATRFALFMAAINLGGSLGAAASGPVGTLLAPWQTVLLSAGIFATCAAVAARPRRLFRLRGAPPAALSHSGEDGNRSGHREEPIPFFRSSP